jgi:hypothetical protein
MKKFIIIGICILIAARAAAQPITGKVNRLIVNDSIRLNGTWYNSFSVPVQNPFLYVQNKVLKFDSAKVWKPYGNIGLPAGSFLGTRDAMDLILKANNLEYLRLKTTGDSILFSRDITLGTDGTNNGDSRKIIFHALGNTGQLQQAFIGLDGFGNTNGERIIYNSPGHVFNTANISDAFKIAGNGIWGAPFTTDFDIYTQSASQGLIIGNHYTQASGELMKWYSTTTYSNRKYRLWMDYNGHTTLGDSITATTDARLHVDGNLRVTDTFKLPRGAVLGYILKCDALGNASWQPTAPAGPAEYTAYWTQTGTNAPTSNILLNTIGAATLDRVSTGTYTITISGAFTANKTTPLNDVMYDNDGNKYTIERTSSSLMTIKTYAAANINILSDNVLNNRIVSIKVYL